jgi:hypothetical protein
MWRLAICAVVMVVAIGFSAANLGHAGNGVLPKVTGGSDARTSVAFNLAVNVIENQDGDVRGKIQYGRDTQGAVLALKFHAKVECSTTFSDGPYATAVGPITNVQDNSSGQITETENWAFVAIKEGNPDRIRVAIHTMDEALAMCTAGETAFPASVVDGDYKIRTW